MITRLNSAIYANTPDDAARGGNEGGNSNRENAQGGNRDNARGTNSFADNQERGGSSNREEARGGNRGGSNRNESGSSR